MSVLLETSVGDIVIDLRTEEAPIACKSFLKLCKVKYYNHCLFHNVQAGALIQTGDPTGSGTGGSSLYGLLYGDQARFFEDEFRRSLRHDRAGVVSMASWSRSLWHVAPCEPTGPLEALGELPAALDRAHCEAVHEMMEADAAAVVTSYGCARFVVSRGLC